MARCHLSTARPPGLACVQGPFCWRSRSHPAIRSRTAAHFLLRRQLTARSVVVPCAQGHEGANERSQQEHRGHRVTGKAGDSEQQYRKRGHRSERAITRPRADVCRGIGLCRCGAERRRCWRQPGRDVGRNRCQIRISARSERLADPRVELLLGHQAIHVRGFECVDDAVAVGVGCAQAPTVFPCCHLARWPGHQSCLPRSQRTRGTRCPPIHGRRRAIASAECGDGASGQVALRGSTAPPALTRALPAATVGLPWGLCWRAADDDR